nr:hypothetical protein [Tanacetum cinerariifolium]
MSSGRICISTKSHNFISERVLVKVHGLNYDTHVHELGTWTINIVDGTLDSSDNFDVNGMKKVEDSVDQNALADLKETINELASNEIQHPISKENMDQDDDINKVSPEIAVSSDLSRPPGFEHIKRTSSKCSTSFARYQKKDIKGVSLIEELSRIIEKRIRDGVARNPDVVASRIFLGFLYDGYSPNAVTNSMTRSLDNPDGIASIPDVISTFWRSRLKHELELQEPIIGVTKVILLGIESVSLTSCFVGTRGWLGASPNTITNSLTRSLDNPDGVAIIPDPVSTFSRIKQWHSKTKTFNRVTKHDNLPLIESIEEKIEAGYANDGNRYCRIKLLQEVDKAKKESLNDSRYHERRLCDLDYDSLETPISLDEVKNAVWDCCSVHYKIIAKILANRLAKVIDNIVSHKQSAFIAGRQIIDGSLILSEIVEWLKKKKKLLISMVDFEKAFDSVFYLASGLKINIQKSNIYGIGVSDVDVSSMANNFGCASVTFPFTYLGLPIGSNMNLTSIWQVLLDRLYRLESEKDCLIIDRIDHGQWRWNWSRPNHGTRNSADLLDMLVEISSIEINEVEDTCKWSLGTNGSFYVNNARCIIDLKILPSLKLSTIWDKNIPLKAISCPSCNGNVESSNHIFFEWKVLVGKSSETFENVIKDELHLVTKVTDIYLSPLTMHTIHLVNFPNVRLNRTKVEEEEDWWSEVEDLRVGRRMGAGGGEVRGGKVVLGMVKSSLGENPGRAIGVVRASQAE